MTKLFIGNFEFEHRLRRDTPHGLPAGPVRRINEELAPVWAAVAEENDLLWLPAPIETGFLDHLAAGGLPALRPVGDPRDLQGPIEACPWGWTDETRRWCERNGLWFMAPPQEIVVEANSRRFSAGLERAWNTGLPGTAIVHSLDELAAALTGLPTGTDGWVIKAEFGMSARERVVGRGRSLPQPAAGWARKRLGGGEALVVEPWVERLEEVGLQYTVPFDDAPVFEGLAALLCDAGGRYRGSRFAPDVDAELRWMPAIETGMRLARLLKARGYFGPLGVDAVRYRHPDGSEGVRALQDINARHSMGRLALGLRRLLAGGESASWLHVDWPTGDDEAPRRWVETFADRLPPEVRLVRTSPFTAGDRPVGHGTLVVTAPSAEVLREAESLALRFGRRSFGGSEPDA